MLVHAGKTHPYDNLLFVSFCQYMLSEKISVFATKGGSTNGKYCWPETLSQKYFGEPLAIKMSLICFSSMLH